MPVTPGGARRSPASAGTQPCSAGTQPCSAGAHPSSAGTHPSRPVDDQGTTTGDLGSERPGLVQMLRRFAGDLAPLVAGLDPATLHANDAARIVEEVVAVERRLAGLRLVCAARAAESAAVADAGSRSAEHWYARQTGVGLQTARRSLRTSQRLRDLDRTRERAMAGGLSEAQLDRVADAASANPTSEASLLQAAGRTGLRGLAAVCDRAKAEVRDEQQERQRLAAVHRHRFLRHSRTADGAFRLEVHTTPDAGARVMAAIDRRAGDLFDAARSDGRREPHHAYQADALVDLVTATSFSTARSVPGLAAPEGTRDAAAPMPIDARSPSGPAGGSGQRTSTGSPTVPAPAGIAFPASAGGEPPGTGVSGPPPPPPPPRPGPAAAITFVVDIEALRRGRLASGERCELTGIGPVPLALVERYLADSRLDLVVTSHTDVAAVCTLSRAIPRALRLALELRDPTCVVPGCDASTPLEIDHITPYAQGGRTQIDNLCRLCPRHHDLKTYRGWTITGPPGHWRFRPPDEPAGVPLTVPPPSSAGASTRRDLAKTPTRDGTGLAAPAPNLFDTA